MLVKTKPSAEVQGSPVTCYVQRVPHGPRGTYVISPSEPQAARGLGEVRGITPWIHLSLDDFRATKP